MIHENFERNIFGKDNFTRRASTHGSVSNSGIDSGKKEPSLRRTLVAFNKTRARKSLGENGCGFDGRKLEKPLQVLVVGVVLITARTPISNVRTGENANVEKGVEKKNAIGSDRGCREKNGIRFGGIKGISLESGLDHHHGIGNVFAHQHKAIECGFVRRTVETLENTRTTHVKHKLWIERQVGRKAKRRFVVFVIIAKMLTQFDESSIDPLKGVKAGSVFVTPNSDSGHQHSCCFLIKTCSERELGAMPRIDVWREVGV